MSNAYLRAMLLSLAVHLAGIYALIAFSLTSCHARRAPRDLMFLVSFQPGPTLGTLRPTEVLPPPRPADMPAPIPEPSKTQLSPASKKPKVEGKTNVVRRAAASEVKRPVKKMSKEQIRAMLASAVASVGPVPAGAPSAGYGAGAGSGSGQATPYGWYLEQVRAIMYEAWQQPSALAGQKGLLTRVEVRVRQDGQITRKEMVAGSGNSLMDNSVMTAVESVQTLPELPFGFGGAYKDITIDFELEETDQ
ncbi:MAG: TonB family protein [Lentisphaerae bacterium]|nr:TonB family protein [Lentisphaerota bacterium]